MTHEVPPVKTDAIKQQWLQEQEKIRQRKLKDSQINPQNSQLG